MKFWTPSQMLDDLQGGNEVGGICTLWLYSVSVVVLELLN